MYGCGRRGRGISSDEKYFIANLFARQFGLYCKLYLLCAVKKAFIRGSAFCEIKYFIND
jgi:hypothetical protein